MKYFNTLKTGLDIPPILGLPKRGFPYMVDTDASQYALGAVLLQEKDIPADKRANFAKKDGAEYTNAWVTNGYWNKTLIAAEMNYSTTERERRSVVWALESLRPYIEGTRFVVRWDHDALRWMMSIADPHGRLARWRLSL